MTRIMIITDQPECSTETVTEPEPTGWPPPWPARRASPSQPGSGMAAARRAWALGRQFSGLSEDSNNRRSLSAPAAARAAAAARSRTEYPDLTQSLSHSESRLAGGVVESRDGASSRTRSLSVPGLAAGPVGPGGGFADSPGSLTQMIIIIHHESSETCRLDEQV
jgi:hypothetical protein